ncbi:CHASE2 domain-containing protein [Novispirillum sp. DQ9]|uniref:CHASE2 domain-containing protein n=1 Tax=Novispirillum sp. DQ9 TaxID=3398612 RepID=UPI003C7B935B
MSTGRAAAVLNRFKGIRFKRPRWRSIFGGARLLGLVVLLVLLVVRVINPAPVELLRVKTFDLYQQLKPRQIVDRPVTIIDIDERSLREIGQWPWDRRTIAELLSRLLALQPFVVGFDIVFPEPDRMSAALIANTLPGLSEEERARLAALPSNDHVLAEVVAKGPVVLGQSTRHMDDYVLPADAPRSSVAVRGRENHLIFDHIEISSGMVRNIPVIDNAGPGRGIFNPNSEVDGVVRRVPMVMYVGPEPTRNAQGQVTDEATYLQYLQPALAAEMLRVATGARSMMVQFNPATGINGFVVGRNLIQTDSRSRVWVYYSRHDKAKYVSAVDVLNGTVPPEKIAGKLLLIGTSAVGLLDIRTSPLDPVLPGVEVHANILENVLTGTQLSRPGVAENTEFLLTAAAGLLMIILLPLVGARYALLLLVVLVGSAGAASWWYFDTQLLLYDPVYPALTIIALYMVLTYANYAREEAQRRQVRDAFSRYMSPALVERLAADPSQLKLGGEMRDMTLLFCDVRGFTTISEQFDAQGLTRLINRFLTPMTNVILDRKGTIDKYMGDCIMAFWNAPLDDDAHAANACRSALAMIDTMKDVNVALEAEAKEEGRKHIPLNVGIGLNSGQVCVGNMGSDQRFDYSVLGDNVNLASRLEGQSKTYGVTVVIGENTHVEAPGFAVLELDLIKVKGKTLPVRIFTLLGDEAFAAGAPFQALKEEHDAMLAAYRLQEWDDVERHIAACRTLAANAGLDLGGLYDLYAERIAAYREASPGAEWDGVFVALSK